MACFFVRDFFKTWRSNIIETNEFFPSQGFAIDAEYSNTKFPTKYCIQKRNLFPYVCKGHSTSEDDLTINFVYLIEYFAIY
jgi:hypothetical protein